MPDAAWMTTGPAQSPVGTATVTDVGDLLTLTAHNLVDGQAVYTATPTGGASALVTGAPYWVASATANTFQLRPSPGAPVIAFAADGTVSVSTAAAEYSDAELRRLDLPLMWPGSTGAATVSGVRPGNAAATLAGTTVTFGPCSGITSAITAPWSATSGPYRWMLTADNQNLTAADGSQPRIDRLVARIQDTTVDSSGYRQAVGAIKVGTPAAVPVAPTVDAGETSLGTVLVPAGGSPVPTLTLDAPDLTALGGVKPATAYPTVGLYNGMAVYRTDLRRLFVREDGAWRGEHQEVRAYGDNAVNINLSTTEVAILGLALVIPSYWTSYDVEYGFSSEVQGYTSPASSQSLVLRVRYPSTSATSVTGTQISQSTADTVGISPLSSRFDLEAMTGGKTGMTATGTQYIVFTGRLDVTDNYRATEKQGWARAVRVS